MINGVSTSSLDETVRRVLGSGRVGRPVFVRWVACVAREGLKKSLGQMLTAAQSWFEAKPERLYAQGGQDAIQLTASVVFTGGQTALVTTVSAPSGRTSCSDLMLLGSRGAIYHDGIPVSAFVEPSVAAEPSRPLLDAIDRSLDTGQPVDVAR